MSLFQNFCKKHRTFLKNGIIKHKMKTKIIELLKSSKKKFLRKREISKILKCDPAAILFPPKKLNVIQLHSYTDDSFMVKDLTKRYYQDVVIPGGFYTPETKAVKFYKIGSQHHEEILLFERYGTKNNYEGFHEDSINKICYLEPNTKKAKEGCAPIGALVKINENTQQYTLDLLHPKTQKPFNELSVGIDPDWIKVCAPRKMVFAPKFNTNL